MTVQDLIDLLEYEVSDKNMTVVFKPYGSDYVESFKYKSNEREISSFYGKNKDAVVIYSDGQVGAI